jgi:small ligand-binding sensory domain FIST
MRTGAGLSTDADPIAAVQEAAAGAIAPLDGASRDLVFLFVSPHHAAALPLMLGVARTQLDPRVLLGCSGLWIIGGAREVEDEPAVAVWAAHLPDTELQPFAVTYDRTPDGDTFLGWPDVVPDGATALALADPFTFPAGQWLEQLNSAHPGLLVIGGMASAGRAPGETRLLLDDEVLWNGCVGVLVSGRTKVRALVSQGCKPIGEPFAVTGSDENLLLSLGGRPPLERLKETFATAPEEDRRAMQVGLHVGRVVDEYKTEFRRGDFLVRNVLGADESSGTIAVGDRMEVGETVQFHVRDAASADNDLREMVERAQPPAGAILFTCNGRGTRLFGVPDHDASIVAGALGDSLAGFFCAGELGPVGGRNFLHGFTASLALFYES